MRVEIQKANSYHYRAQEWTHMHLTTIGQSCRAMMRETLGKTIAWVVRQVQQGQSLSSSRPINFAKLQLLTDTRSSR